MRDPLHRFKFLPWRSLIQISALVTIIVIVLEFLLELGHNRSAVFRNALYLIGRPPFGSLIPLLVALGLGALAVYLLELLHPQLSINTAILWTLVLCVALFLILKSLLPLPANLVNFDQLQLVGLVVGTFWKGRPYWRKFN